MSRRGAKATLDDFSQALHDFYSDWTDAAIKQELKRRTGQSLSGYDRCTLIQRLVECVRAQEMASASAGSSAGAAENPIKQESSAGPGRPHPNAVSTQKPPAAALQTASAPRQAQKMDQSADGAVKSEAVGQAEQDRGVKRELSSPPPTPEKKHKPEPGAVSAAATAHPKPVSAATGKPVAVTGTGAPDLATILGLQSLAGYPATAPPSSTALVPFRPPGAPVARDQHTLRPSDEDIDNNEWYVQNEVGRWQKGPASAVAADRPPPCWYYVPKEAQEVGESIKDPCGHSTTRWEHRPTKYKCGCAQICDNCSLCRGKPLLMTGERGTKANCRCRVCKCRCKRKGTVGKTSGALSKAIKKEEKKAGPNLLERLLASDDPQKAAMFAQLALTSMSSAQLKGLQSVLQGVLPNPFAVTSSSIRPADMLPQQLASSPALPQLGPALPQLAAPAPVVAKPAASALLAWLRSEETTKHISSDDAAKLEHIAATSAHPLHEELALHWATFGEQPLEMLKSVSRVLAQMK